MATFGNDFDTGSYWAGAGGAGGPSGGGGGFLQGSPGASGGGYTQQHDTPKKQNTGADKRVVTPVTLIQLRKAIQAPDDAFQLDGKELGQITFVAAIAEMNVQDSNSITFVMDDGTDTSEVKYWMDKDESEYLQQKRAGWQVGTYVRVSGQLRSMQDQRNVTAYHLRTITDFNEITFHNLDVIATHLYNTRGPLNADGSVASRTAVKAEPMHSASSSGMGVPSIPYDNGSFGGDFTPCRQAVLQSVQRLATGQNADTGASKGAIFNDLRGRFSELEISAALEFLATEAHLYNTIDDEHYQLCNSM